MGHPDLDRIYAERLTDEGAVGTSGVSLGAKIELDNHLGAYGFHAGVRVGSGVLAFGRFAETPHLVAQPWLVPPDAPLSDNLGGRHSFALHEFSQVAQRVGFVTATGQDFDSLGANDLWPTYVVPTVPPNEQIVVLPNKGVSRDATHDQIGLLEIFTQDRQHTVLLAHRSSDEDTSMLKIADGDSGITYSAEVQRWLVTIADADDVGGRTREITHLEKVGRQQGLTATQLANFSRKRVQAFHAKRQVTDAELCREIISERW
jgi:hypothetical protein